MSHGGRAFQTHGYSAISPDAMRAHRQSMLNQQHQQFVQHQQQAVMTSVSTPTSTSAYSNSHHHAAAAAAAAAAVAGNNTSSSTSSNASTASNNSQRRGMPIDSMYCDNCNVFRHATYFTDERGIKYNVCILCRAPTQQLQKRKQMYEEQERAFKHARYSQHQHQQQQQQQQQQLTSRFLHTPPNAGSPSIQVKASPPNFSASPLRTQSQLQSHVQAQVMQPSLPSLPMPPQQQPQPQHLHLPPYQPPPPPPERPSQSPIPPPSIPPGATTVSPVATTVATSMAAAAAAAAAAVSQPPSQPPPMMNGNAGNGGPAVNGRISPKQQQQVKQEVLSLEGFVHALQQETEFDRKHYDVDIMPLIQRMGEGAGFSQLGRGVCEHVLTGTKFNFSLKDQRRSIKTPDTLSTLRYYCSQRADTAKPRKASDHPKATNRYDCAGALTIIIDLTKKTAHVTLIHKHSHPPFVPHHHHHYHNSSSQQQQQPTAAAAAAAQQQQQQKRLMQQRAKQIDKQFDALRQKVSDFGRLLESQQPFKNKDFIQTATEAFAGAEEMLTACVTADQAAMSGMIAHQQPENKYTMHYNKKGNM